MDEIWSFSGVIALWIAISCGLWWVHRFTVRRRQRRDTDRAKRAAVLVSEAPGVFDAIRAPAVLATPPSDPDARLTAWAHTLLKRIQDHGAFFDQVNALRVEMQAAFGIDDYEPLSEILQIRRDLWAASEIILVEDPSSFSGSFAEAGSYQRFRDEAVAFLFKADAGERQGEDDIIDLRLSLARKQADEFVVTLDDAIREARERDRLPTISEIIAYPLAALHAIPEMVTVASRFLSAFFAYSGDIARTIRNSETMERGRWHLQNARETLPQRLSAGFERGSAAARDSAISLRRHYDFLAAAHDFQAKYERVLHRAPELTERGRQFIARLELAERSERLRLTSANVMIWVARRLVDGLAHLIAGLQLLISALSRTTPWALLAMIFAPAPVRGRQTAAFPSFSMALAASGLKEEREALPVRPLPGVSEPAKRKPAAKGTAPARAKEKAGQAKGRAAAPPPVKAPAQKKAKSAEKAKATPAPAKSTPEKSAIIAKPAADIAAAAKATPNLEPGRRSFLGRFLSGRPSPSAEPAPRKRSEATQVGAIHAPEKPLVIAKLAADIAPAAPAAANPEPRRSFLGRLLFARKSPSAEPAAKKRRKASPAEQSAISALLESMADAAPEFAIAPAAETQKTLLARLSEIEQEGQEPAPAATAGADNGPNWDQGGGDEEDADDDLDEPGPLTLSLTELQAKTAAKPSPIRSFPWLKG